MDSWKERVIVGALANVAIMFMLAVSKESGCLSMDVLYNRGQSCLEFIKI